MSDLISRRRVLALAAPLACAGLLAACAGLIGPRQVTLPLDRLQHSLAQRFPIPYGVLGVFELTLSAPQLRTVGQNDRVELAADLAVTSTLVRQVWRGQLALSGRLVVDPARNAVFLGDARVERFAIDGIGAAQQRQLAAAANTVTGLLVHDVPVYTFRPDDLRYAGVQFTPTAIRTTPTALLVQLEPVK